MSASFHSVGIDQDPDEIGEYQIHGIGDLRHEVVDISIPLAIVRGGEEQLRVVIQEDEAHVVEGANDIRALEVALQQLQQAA